MFGDEVFIIAEIGLNHGGSIEAAKALIDSAVRAGVDAVKFQTYRTALRAPQGNDAIAKILSSCELPFEAFPELKKHAEDQGVVFFSTPFDAESLQLLDDIGCEVFKLASFDVTNTVFLRKVSETQKKILLSTGMANLDELKKAYAILSSSSASVALLHCVSAYPTKSCDANLRAIVTLQKNFDCCVGQSDHTSGIEVPLYAVAVGARIIEKHFKLHSKHDCVDAPVSITEEQMRALVAKVRELEEIMGSGELGMTAPQEAAKIFRRAS